MGDKYNDINFSETDQSKKETKMGDDGIHGKEI